MSYSHAAAAAAAAAAGAKDSERLSSFTPKVFHLTCVSAQPVWCDAAAQACVLDLACHFPDPSAALCLLPKRSGLGNILQRTHPKKINPAE